MKSFDGKQARPSEVAGRHYLFGKYFDNFRLSGFMSKMRSIQRQRQRRTWSVRNKVRRSGSVRLRLSVFRSNRHIYAQVIDDLRRVTVVAASTCESTPGLERSGSGGLQSAEIVGARLARRCLELGVSSVVFDRGCYKFHGRVAAIAEGARRAGLDF